MKFKLFGIVAICFFIFIGCNVNNFFDVDSCIKPPRLTADQQNLKDTLADYLKSEFVWSYVIVNERRSNLVECSIEKNQKEEVYNFAFCRLNEKISELHIIVLKKGETGLWKVIDEIVLNPPLPEKVYIKEENNKIGMFLCGSSDSQSISEYISSYYYT